MDKAIAPLISVLMPVYNCACFVAEALSSILQQTVIDFEVIIVDDASTDDTLRTVGEFHDSRILIVRKSSNSGYSDSLNLALGIARGEYIARMDGDDICLKDRFEKQLKFLADNPGIVACGTNYQVLDSDQESAHPSCPDDVKVHLLSGCYVAHPTAMIRRSVLVDNQLKYRPELEPAEDYNLWTELCAFGGIGNLPQKLLYYRAHPHQVSIQKSALQQEHADRARVRMLQYLFPGDISELDLQTHLALMKGNCERAIPPHTVFEWVEKFEAENQISNFFNQQLLSEFLSNKFKYYLLLYQKQNPTFLRRFSNKILRMKKFFIGQ